MVAVDRYCLDVVQQLTAVIAAARAVTTLVIEDHLLATLDEALVGHDAESARREIIEVRGKALRD